MKLLRHCTAEMRLPFGKTSGTLLLGFSPWMLREISGILLEGIFENSVCNPTGWYKNTDFNGKYVYYIILETLLSLGSQVPQAVTIRLVTDPPFYLSSSAISLLICRYQLSFSEMIWYLLKSAVFLILNLILKFVFSSEDLDPRKPIYFF